MRNRKEESTQKGRCLCSGERRCWGAPALVQATSGGACAIFLCHFLCCCPLIVSSTEKSSCRETLRRASSLQAVRVSDMLAAAQAVLDVFMADAGSTMRCASRLESHLAALSFQCRQHCSQLPLQPPLPHHALLRSLRRRPPLLLLRSLHRCFVLVRVASVLLRIRRLLTFPPPPRLSSFSLFLLSWVGAARSAPLARHRQRSRSRAPADASGTPMSSDRVAGARPPRRSRFADRRPRALRRCARSGADAAGRLPERRRR